MSYRWEYPLFLVRIDDGFAAVQVASDGEQRQFAVVVFTDQSRCRRFSETLQLDGEIVKLNNDREFAALVSLFRPPFTSVVFDSAPEGTAVNADWQTDIATLLADHLPLAKSPWGYPLFAAPGKRKATPRSANRRKKVKLLSRWDCSLAGIWPKRS